MSSKGVHVTDRRRAVGAAMITGGAGGIALRLAERLAARGYRLILVDLNEGALAEAAAHLPDGAQTVTADLARPDDLVRVANMVTYAPDLTLLINCAGVIRPGNVADVPFSALTVQMDMNLHAPLRLLHAAAVRFKAERQGCLLSVVSAAGLAALPGSAAYTAAKFGLRGFLISLSHELAPHGVKVRGVYPGAVDTPMLRYEATHGGSPLNFLNKDVLTADQVADACLRAIDGTRLETLLPTVDGLFSRLVCAFPALLTPLLPRFERAGRKGMQRFLASRGLTADAADVHGI